MQWHPFTLLFPDIPEGQEWEAFRAGIEATGGNKLMPIFARMVNGKPQGLAGRNRYRACKELRIKPTIKFVTLKDEEVEGFIIRDNINRRHMTPELRQALVAKLREQGQSTRQIADTLQVDQKTVRNDLQVSGEEFSSPETVKGRDGKHYSATQDSPVHCRRCTRMGTAVKDCPQCAEAQVKAAAKARASKVRPERNGQITNDMRKFNDVFGFLVREIDKLAKMYNQRNTPAQEKLHEELHLWRNKFKEWHATLTRMRATQT